MINDITTNLIGWSLHMQTTRKKLHHHEELHHEQHGAFSLTICRQ
jgi:hypothetical protein